MEKNMIQKATRTEKAALRDLVQRMQPEIAKALPSVITPERFTRIVLSAISRTPKLAECTPASFLAAMMQAAQLGLEPNTPLGQAYLIPYRNHGQNEVQFQLGYKGLLDLAYRSGEISTIQAHTVYERDEFEYEFGLDSKLRHKPSMEADKGKPIAFYAMFRTKDGGCGFDVMSVDDVIAYARRYSKSYDTDASPWKTAFEEMAKKTVLKRLLKYAPMKSDFIRQVAAEDTLHKLDMTDGSITDEMIIPAEGDVSEPEEAPEI